MIKVKIFATSFGFEKLQDLMNSFFEDNKHHITEIVSVNYQDANQYCSVVIIYKI